MDAMTDLLQDFGFTRRAANKVAQKAYENDLTWSDVQAWIDEANASESLHNPQGFVRARIQSGDKVPPRAAAGRRHRPRYEYGCQSICPHCGAAPCMCAAISTQKENNR